MKLRAYKGFDKDLKCRAFQYEVGKEYSEEKADICSCGFHACEHPLDTFRYYSPNESRYCEVALAANGQRRGDDSKRVGKHIAIKGELSIAGLVKAAIDYTFENTKESTKDCGASSATGDYGASSATGYKGASSATGSCGASSATGDYGASSATGSKGASSATGDYGASSATGDYGASSATGDNGASSATGYKGASSATGYKGASSATGSKGASSATGSCGASSATGYKGASSADNKDAVAVAWGYKSKAKGVIGAHLVFADWEGDEDLYRTPEAWTLKGAKMVQVDGKKIKENTWYCIENGEIIEVKEED